jgi:hypothetical protein
MKTTLNRRHAGLPSAVTGQTAEGLADWTAVVSGFGSTYGEAIYLGLNQPSSERMACDMAARECSWPLPSRADLKNEWSSNSNLLCEVMARTETSLRTSH